MRYIYFLFILLLSFSCLNDDSSEKIHVKIQLAFSDEYADTVGADREIIFMNSDNGRKFITRTDTDNIADMLLDCGVYDVSCSFRTADDYNFNGKIQSLVISDTELSDTLPLTMYNGKRSALIFKEIYYSGSKTPNNKNYFADQFYEIYNNSDEVQYLDGLCLSFVHGLSMKKTHWVDEKGELLPELPLDQMAWMIPGEGTDHPLAPGESIIIAQDAINHKTDPSGNPNSDIDMSNADWETYFHLSGKDTDISSVPNLQLIWQNNEKMLDFFHFPMGFAVVLFRIDEGAEEYGSNPDNERLEPGSTLDKKYLVIPKEYVLDGVECVMSEMFNNKRLHNEIDAGYIYCSSTYSYESVRRKVEEVRADGRIIYKDSNNSTYDFEVITPPTPGKHP